MLRTSLTLALALLLTACPTESGDPDGGGGSDAGADAGSDGGSDAGPDCSLSDHAGCTAEQLCCEQSGVPTCVPSEFQQCGTCGEACDPTTADICIDRVCGCGLADACEGATPRCNTSTRRCIGCLGSAECAGQLCVNEACADCNPADHAGCGGRMPICNAATSTCEACTASPDNCPSPLVCTAQGFCGGCDPATHTGCSVPTAPICDPTSTVCRPCESDAECQSDLGEPICAALGSCAACDPVDHRGCDESAPVCTEDLLAGTITCTTCLVNADCAAYPSSPVCSQSGASAGTCVPCEFGQVAACTGATPYCDFTTNQCSADCSSPFHCSGNTPICDVGGCRGCQGDDECALIGRTSCGSGSCN